MRRHFNSVYKPEQRNVRGPVVYTEEAGGSLMEKS